jgi:hypothetical protein
VSPPSHHAWLRRASKRVDDRQLRLVQERLIVALDSVDAFIVNAAVNVAVIDGVWPQCTKGGLPRTPPGPVGVLDVGVQAGPDTPLTSSADLDDPQGARLTVPTQSGRARKARVGPLDGSGAICSRQGRESVADFPVVRADGWASSAWRGFEQFDEVAGGVGDQDLASAGAGCDVAAEGQPGLA